MIWDLSCDPKLGSAVPQNGLRGTPKWAPRDPKTEGMRREKGVRGQRGEVRGVRFRKGEVAGSVEGGSEGGQRGGGTSVKREWLRNETGNRWRGRGAAHLSLFGELVTHDEHLC